MKKEAKEEKYIKCGDCNKYMSGKCALFEESRETYDGCKYGETGGMHSDVAKYYRNRGF